MSRLLVITCILLMLNDVYLKELPINDNYKDVVIDSGTVRGFLAEDADYIAYLGIPYAEPPIGNLRFKAPIPPQPWNTTFIAKHTVKCPQNGIGDENCLIVNVFTPLKKFDSPLPVLFYIHGGSFLGGSGQTKGVGLLIKQNVIVVTINYRLGALGFLCLSTEDAPGNAGLKDQVAALKWVNKNINKFGGDPDQVTIYGMSAGGTSIEMLVFTKMTEGLFQNAIVESGAALSVWAVDANPIDTAINVAKMLNNSEDNINAKQLAEFYQKIPANELSKINIEYYENLTDGTFGFVPCLEKQLPDVDAILTDSPNNILNNEDYNKVPIMFIFATLEGLFLRSSNYYEQNYKERMNLEFKEFMPADLTFKSEETRNKLADYVKGFYFGDETVGDNTLKSYFDFFGDNLIMNGLLNSALTHSKNGDVVYLMEFAYKGKQPAYDNFFDNIDYAGHGDAIKYTILEHKLNDNNDKVTMHRMSKIVTNFMKYSNPTPLRSELFPVEWPAISPNKVSYFRLDREVKVLEDPLWDRKVFWDKIYDTYRKPLNQVKSTQL